ncbi:MAG: hypothetical protein WCD70_01600 [Alphaproteobacteria bacterium]
MDMAEIIPFPSKPSSGEFLAVHVTFKSPKSQDDYYATIAEFDRLVESMKGEVVTSSFSQEYDKVTKSKQLGAEAIFKIAASEVSRLENDERITAVRPATKEELDEIAEDLLDLN